MHLKITRIILITVMYLALSSTLAYATVYLTLDEALNLAFPDTDKIVKKKIYLDSKARGEIGEAAHQRIDESSYEFYVGVKGDKPVAYMVVDNVIGKSEPITYMVVFTPEGAVKRVEVMVFREPQGGEVRHRAFLKQYEGKKLTDRLSVGEDIRNISGATLSTMSITAGVEKLLAVFQYAFLRVTTTRE